MLGPPGQRRRRPLLRFLPRDRCVRRLLMRKRGLRERVLGDGLEFGDARPVRMAGGQNSRECPLRLWPLVTQHRR